MMSQCALEGVASVDVRASMMKWILVLDMHKADPETLSELVKEYEAGPKEGFSSSDILGQLLYTSKLGNRLLDAAVAFSKDSVFIQYNFQIRSFFSFYFLCVFLCL